MKRGEWSDPENDFNEPFKDVWPSDDSSDRERRGTIFRMPRRARLVTAWQRDPLYNAINQLSFIIILREIYA